MINLFFVILYNASLKLTMLVAIVCLKKDFHLSVLNLISFIGFPNEEWPLEDFPKVPFSHGMHDFIQLSDLSIILQLDGA